MQTEYNTLYTGNASLNSKEYRQMIKQCAALIEKNNNTLLLLYGNLGAGKTFFTKQLLRELGLGNVVVTSPTFNILHTYSTKIGTVYHYDLYRIKHPDELINLDIEDALESFLTIIEWPEIAEDFLVRHTSCLLKITIAYLPNTDSLRSFTIVKTTPNQA